MSFLLKNLSNSNHKQLGPSFRNRSTPINLQLSAFSLWATTPSVPKSTNRKKTLWCSPIWRGWKSITWNMACAKPARASWSATSTTTPTFWYCRLRMPSSSCMWAPQSSHLHLCPDLRGSGWHSGTNAQTGRLPPRRRGWTRWLQVTSQWALGTIWDLILGRGCQWWVAHCGYNCAVVAAQFWNLHVSIPAGACDETQGVQEAVFHSAAKSSTFFLIPRFSSQKAQVKQS